MLYIQDCKNGKVSLQLEIFSVSTRNITSFSVVLFSTNNEMLLLLQNFFLKSCSLHFDCSRTLNWAFTFFSAITLALTLILCDVLVSQNKVYQLNKQCHLQERLYHKEQRISGLCCQLKYGFCIWTISFIFSSIRCG